MSATLTETQITAVRKSLGRVSGSQSAADRLRRLLANESVLSNWDSDVVALRGWLLRMMKNDESLLESVASTAVWESLVADAKSWRETLSDDHARRVVVAEKAASLVAGIVGEVGAGLGTGGGNGLSNARTRWIVAVAGVRVLRDIWEGKRGSTVVSAMRLEAELGTDADDIGRALNAGVDVGVLAVVSRHSSGAKRYGIRSLPKQEFTATMLRYGPVVESLVERITGERPDVLRLLAKSDSEMTGEWWESRMERKARKAQDSKKATPPRGAMTAVEADRAGGVAAELLLVADSPGWAGRGQNRATVNLWLGMLLGVLGEQASKHCTSGRVREAFGDEVFERLNAGDSLTTILSERLSPEAATKAEERMAAWSSRSSEIRATTSAWTLTKNHAEDALTMLLGRADDAPRWEAGEEARWIFNERMRAVVAEAGLNEAAAGVVSRRLKRRLIEYRGWPRVDAGIAVGIVFPSTVKVEVSEPMLVGGVLVRAS